VIIGEVNWALGTNEDAAIKILSELIEKEWNPQAFELLGRFGAKAKAALPALEKWVKQQPYSFVTTERYAPHVAVYRIDPKKKDAMLAEIPVTPHSAHARLAIDPKDEAALKAVRGWLAEGNSNLPMYSTLGRLTPPPEELREALERALIPNGIISLP